jgi:hypothetical protein
MGRGADLGIAPVIDRNAVARYHPNA